MTPGKGAAMPEPHPQSSTQRGRERVYERASDPAEGADRPLEPKSSHEPLARDDQPHPRDADPHDRLNTPIGDVDPDADSDPYRPETDEDDVDRASGVRGAGQGSEDR
jgi:hypothetical protein